VAAPIRERHARDRDAVSGWPRPLVGAVDLLNRRGKSVGVRLAKYTGKSGDFVHPKHLVDTPWHDWYVEHLHPGDVVLDVGCANGAHTVKAAARACRIVGMDYDVRQLAIARRTALRASVHNVHLFAWDLTRGFPFPAKT
jgi:tRNA G46 methylase TrmB